MRERIIDYLNEKDMSKTELANALGYPRVTNSLTYQLNKLIDEKKVAVYNHKYYLC